ncbi:hypothetical protein SAPIO_CDS9396 [Scedosporium apiospermum]|uniref:Velvet domain-containing protein n=1 Tax=Pseudallescheria apiosperma TaxID=563466 RepID=A0A084FWQ9_PSEDA|nr:uncharacterized protein SAPIO_CDS9396 [Scedosporium apiospermum]KEZ39521.1 hypothetical protein SAPIO_CDS9396 [Scedosporium apiospermum]
MSIAIQAPRSLEPLYCQGIYNGRLESTSLDLPNQSYPNTGTSNLMSAMTSGHNPRHPYGGYPAPQPRPPQYDPIQNSPSQFAQGHTPPAQMQRLPMMTPPAPMPTASTPTLTQSPVLQQEPGSYVGYSPTTEPASPTPPFTLTIRQEPDRAKVVLGKDKDRKPVDPPPILQLEVPPQNNHILQSPYHFVMAFLIDEKEDTPVSCQNGNPLFGTQVSSLHKLKDTNNQDGGFFVFGDLSVKVEGKFRLKFTLYEVSNGEVVQLGDITSRVFEVYSPKHFPGMEESTFLTRSFSDQGVRLRLRKDSRSMTTRKRNSQAAKLADQMSQQRYQPRARIEPPPPSAYESMHQGNGWWTSHSSPHTPGAVSASGPPSAGPYGPTSQTGGYGADPSAPRYGPQ